MIAVRLQRHSVYASSLREVLEGRVFWDVRARRGSEAGNHKGYYSNWVLHEHKEGGNTE